MIVVPQSVELLWYTPEPLKQIESAGRTCYRSENKIEEGSAESFVSRIIGWGHSSVIEHASASFRIITDRGITHQIVRHRLASYSQESTRYCNYAQDRFDHEIRVIKPLNLEEGDPSYNEWYNGCLAAEKSYFKMIELGSSPQVARDILPTCTKTELVMTCNFREWLHVLGERESKRAHPKVVVLANKIRQELNKIAPTVFPI